MRRYAASTSGRGGDRVGVVLGSGALTDSQMLAVARALGYSLTAFVVCHRSGAPPEMTEAAIRFFGAAGELPFDEHGAIAAAVALAEHNGPGRLRVSTAGGALTVATALEDGQLVATLLPPTGTGLVAAAPVSGRATRLALSPYDELDQL